MEILKDEATTRLDEMSRALDEALTMYDSLVTEIEDEALRRKVTQHAEAQRSVLQALFDERQRRDELPQAGDDERAELLAFFTAMHGFVTQTDTPVIARIADANRQIGSIATATRRSDLPENETRLIGQLIESSEALDALLDSAGD